MNAIAKERPDYVWLLALGLAAVSAGSLVYIQLKSAYPAPCNHVVVSSMFQMSEH